MNTIQLNAYAVIVHVIALATTMHLATTSCHPIWKQYSSVAIETR